MPWGSPKPDQLSLCAVYRRAHLVLQAAQHLALHVRQRVVTHVSLPVFPGEPGMVTGATYVPLMRASG